MMARTESRVAWRMSASDTAAPLAAALSLTFFSMTFSTRPQLPSSAETSSPFACNGQDGFDQDAPLAFFLTSIGVVLQRGEEVLPLRIDRLRIVLIGGLQLLDIVGIAAIEERSQREFVVGLILSCHLLHAERPLRLLFRGE